jgi:hypothetical protein
VLGRFNHHNCDYVLEEKQHDGKFEFILHREYGITNVSLHQDRGQTCPQLPVTAAFCSLTPASKMFWAI